MLVPGEITSSLHSSCQAVLTAHGTNQPLLSEDANPMDAPIPTSLRSEIKRLADPPIDDTANWLI